MRISQKEALLVLILSLILAPTIASAEILISQPEALYSKGDNFDLTITVNAPVSDVSDFLTARLLCDGESIEIYKSPVSLQKEQEKEIRITTMLGRFLVGATQGNCQVRAEFADDVTDSARFELTNNVDVSLNIEGVLFDPGANFKAYGEAKKGTGANLEGFVEVSIPELDFQFIGQINEGIFDFNVTIPDNAPSGSYSIEAHAYERDAAGEILNEGKTESIIKINAIIREVEIALAEQTIIPNNDLRYTLIVYDQAKEKVDTDAQLTFYDPEGNIISKDLVETDTSFDFPIASNSSPGYWKIEAQKDDFIKERTFFVEENKELAYKLEDTTLTITNVGNVPYSGPVEVNIGDIKEIKEITKLSIGEIKQYKLVAPDGEYAIGVGDGSKQADLGQTFLTGRVVSVEDIGSVLGANLTIIIALVVILIIAIVSLYIYRKVSKGKAQGPGAAKPFSPGLVKKDSADAKLATVVDNGKKEESLILAIKVKNPSVLEKADVAKALDSALWKAKEANAKVYVNGDFRIAVFTPLLTREKDNKLPAIRTAQTIQRMLTEHNKKFSPKIEFGIGVNNGELIVEMREGKFRFMSIDNTIAAAKNIAQTSTGRVLISEKLHRVTAGKIKTQKIPNFSLWEVVSITDRSAHKTYLKNMGAKN